MKKVLFALVILFNCYGVAGQTLLSAHRMEFKKDFDGQFLTNAVNAQTQEIFVFAADKQNLNIQKYNSAVFFTDSLAVMRPAKEYSRIAGHSFDGQNNPVAYWSSEDFKKILAVTYDFKNRDTIAKSYVIPFSGENLLGAFSENNSFYLFSAVQKEKLLKFHVFKNGDHQEKTVDLSPYSFTDEKGKELDLAALLKENPLEIIDTKALNPLYYATKKIKCYPSGQKMILTFDLDPRQTQYFEIDLTDFTVSEKKIPQPESPEDGNSNSFFHQGKLYQLKLSADEMSLSATNLDPFQLLKTYTARAADTIRFKNSPLYSQTGNQRALELKNTKKFLRKLSLSDIGLSVYKTPEDILLTIGGSRNVANTGEILLAVTAGTVIIASGSSNVGDVVDLLGDSHLQVIYFESLFDDGFQYKDLEQQRLASDDIAQFLDGQEKISLQNIFNYRDYYILGYYDAKSKQYIMRKFTDDSAQNSQPGPFSFPKQ